MKTLSLVTLLLVNIYSLTVFAGGYEKAVMWSGKWSALGNSASAYVDGSDAAFFNPAGLVGGADQEISVNLSPTFSRFKAPILVSGQQQVGSEVASPIFAGTYKLDLSEQWAFGGSLGVAAGSKAKYVDISPVPGSAEIGQMTSLEDVELSLGFGYVIDEQWSLGFSWRASFISADLQAVAPNAAPAGFAELNFSDLSATDLGGYRLGAQYRPNENWGMGFVYRSSVDFEADGKFQAFLVPNASPSTKSVIVPTKDLKGLTSTLPDAYSLDYFRQLNDTWKIFFGYTKTMYSKNEKIVLGDNGLIAELAQNWNDQENIRFATEFTGAEDWVVRGAYVYTSQVVPADYASPTFSTPGAGHTLVIGGGQTLLEKYTFDLSLEHSWADGADVTNLNGISGDYNTTATALHASVKMPL